MEAGRQTNINVFHFKDYRLFLKEYAEEKRQKYRGWSYGVWAKKMGLAGAGSISMIVNGKRHPSNQVIDRFSEYFCFDYYEKRYFEDLIKLEKIQSDSRLSIALLKEMDQRQKDREKSILDEEVFESISNWYFYAIREMTNLSVFHEDYDWIADTLFQEVTPAEVEHAIEQLCKVGLLGRDAFGKLRPSNDMVETTTDVASEAVKQYQLQILDKAKQALRKVPPEKREIISSTMTIQEKDIPRAKELIRKFRDDFVNHLEKGQGDATCQLNIQFFPLTKLPEERL